ncbi:MAG: diguanylate cyclase [Myxococcaceae bacterium]
MSDSEKPNAEQRLVALWSAVRDATSLLRRGEADELVEAPHLSSVLQALAFDVRRLARLIEARQTSAPIEAERPMVEGDRARVLVVDDDPNAAGALKDALEPQFAARAATDPSEVLHLAKETPFDAVVTDLQMPGIDGLALLELLQREVTPPPPVLLISGMISEKQRLEALEQGAFDVMSKPLDLPELTARLHRAVRYGRELARQRTLQGTDELTGLLNRRAFKTALSVALRDRRSGAQPQLAVAMIDQDGLKRVNDAYGHARGDEAIALVANALRRARRTSDLAARIGGDEFALVMPGTDRVGAENVLARVAKELAATALDVGAGERLPLSVSWGVATLLPADRFTEGAALLERADEALYEMKRRKRAVPTHVHSDVHH